MLTTLAEKLGALVVSSTAGKGIIPDDHPLALGGGVTCEPVHENIISRSDCVLAVGTELAQPDSFYSVLKFTGKLIRVDIDPSKLNDLHACDVGIAADAAKTLEKLTALLEGHDGENIRVAAIEAASDIRTNLISEAKGSAIQHIKLLAVLRDCTTEDTIYATDACQIAYTGAYAMPVMKPRQWLFPSGYCALGNAIPNAIGAKRALPDKPVIAIAGDGGSMFTIQELLVGAELEMPLPIIIWNNRAYKQIRDDMDQQGIGRVGVEGLTPDFQMLARACRCEAAKPASVDEFKQAIREAFSRSVPTLIEIVEDSEWLTE